MMFPRETKYRFEENGVYETEQHKFMTVHKRVLINEVDYVVICPKSDKDELVLEKIIYDGDSEVFICEPDDDEPQACYASKKVDEVKKGYWDEKENDDDTVNFVFKLK